MPPSHSSCTQPIPPWSGLTDRTTPGSQQDRPHHLQLELSTGTSAGRRSGPSTHSPATIMKFFLEPRFIPSWYYCLTESRGYKGYDFLPRLTSWFLSGTFLYKWYPHHKQTVKTYKIISQLPCSPYPAYPGSDRISSDPSLGHLILTDCPPPSHPRHES